MVPGGGIEPPTRGFFNGGGNKLLFKYSNLLIEIYGVRKNVFIGAMSLLNFNKQNQCVEHGILEQICTNHPALMLTASKNPVQRVFGKTTKSVILQAKPLCQDFVIHTTIIHRKLHIAFFEQT